jgi:pimeloyl-ACP methyl ester carboxylesterase
MANKRLHFGRLDGGSAPTNQAAIVFIHGFTGDWQKTWGRIPEFLRPALSSWDLYGFGYESNRRFDLLGLWSADASLQTIADMLYARSVNELKSYRALAFVAHSMGGLVAQEALTRRDDLRQRLSHVFLFGTPSAGLKKADKLSFIKQQIRDMDDNGPFVHNLRKRWSDLKLDGQANFKFLATAGEIDQFVPPESSILPFPQAVRRVVPGNHVSMLDVASENDPTVLILRNGFTSGAAPGQDSARVAVESGEFHKLVQQFWPQGKPMPQGLDDAGAVQLAIALDQVDRRDDAIELLRQHKPRGTDALGVLAGRLKRRWIVTRSEEDYQSALDLYQRAYEQARAATPPDHDQAYYHGINLAFLVLAPGSNFSAALERAQQLANEVLEHCSQAKDPKSVHWRLATEGDAHMILGDSEQGLKKHREAAARSPKPWECVSMEEQAIRIARLVGPGQDEQLAAIYEGPE